MSAKIIDGNAASSALREGLAARVAKLKADGGPTPGLAVVLVGSDPASQVYVKSKHKRATETGMNSFEHLAGDPAGAGRHAQQGPVGAWDPGSTASAPTDRR